MPFPLEIVPQDNYKLMLNFNELCEKYHDLVILRQIPISPELAIEDSEAMNGTKLISEDAIKKALEGNLAQLSTNLLGGKYEFKHIPVRCIGEKSYNQWDGQNHKGVNYTDDDFEIKDPVTALAFKINKLHRMQFPYCININNINDGNLRNEQAEKVAQEKRLTILTNLVKSLPHDSQKAKALGYITVDHFPVISNYWHVHVNTYHANQTEPVSEKNKKKNDKILLCEFRLLLSANSYPFRLEHSTLSESDYKD